MDMWTVEITQRTGAIKCYFDEMADALEFVGIVLETSDYGVTAAITKNEPADL